MSMVRSRCMAAKSRAALTWVRNDNQWFNDKDFALPIQEAAELPLFFRPWTAPPGPFLPYRLDFQAVDLALPDHLRGHGQIAT